MCKLMSFNQVRWPRPAVVLAVLLYMCGPLPAPRAADALFYGVIKSQRYGQTTNAPPALLATNAYAFNAFVVPTNAFAVTNATVKAPSPSTVPTRTLVTNQTGMLLLYDERFNTQGELDAAYPTAQFNSYTFKIYGSNDGLRTATVNFLGATMPPTPQLSNLDQAQQIDTRAEFTLTWNSLGGSALDIVQLSITDMATNPVYSSPEPMSSNALNGASTSLVLPAYSLPPGVELVGHLSIGRPGLPNTTSYPGATGLAELGRDTEFPLVTLPPVIPRLSVGMPMPQPFEVTYTGESNRYYLLQASTNMIDWLDITVTNTVSEHGSITDDSAGDYQCRFYRIEVVH